jgi:uncharacterized protein
MKMGTFVLRQRGLFNLLVIFALVLGFLPASSTPVLATGVTDLFFSEYIEGSSNNKALEIYNGTGAAIDLGAAGYNVQMFFNGSTSAGLTINLIGTVTNGDVFVLAHSSAVPVILAEADLTNGSGWFNGDDAVVLRKGDIVIDVIGQIGFDPGSQWGTDLTSTADNTLRRKATVLFGDTNGSDVFDPSIEWEGFANDTFDGLGAHTVIAGETPPYVASTVPANGDTGVALDASIVVTFSEPVNISTDWFDLSCTQQGSVSAASSGGPQVFTVTPDAPFLEGQDCTFTVYAAAVTDQDADDPPDSMESDYVISFSTQSAVDICTLPFTPIYDIQGSGPATPIPGVVTTQGVVVGDYEGPSPTLRGFYLQDLTGDGNPETSDGVFVFNGSNNSVSLGDVVRITATASEFQDQTQLSNVTEIIPCGTGSVDPVDVTLPVASADYLERYEGMLVRLPQTLYVTEHFQLGRFGQVVMSSEGRLKQPTNVVEPGAPALALQAANNLNRIIIDDALNVQNPDPILFGRGGNPLSASNTLRGGDTATGIVGVMTYTWAGNSASGNAYRVRPINALGGGVPDFKPTNPRPVEPEEVGGSLKVTGFNVLNYFNNFGNTCFMGVGGEATSCRGANNLTEFERQAAKIVAALAEMDAAIVGLMEIENDGYGQDSATQDLVNRLNAVTAPGTYALINVDAGTGQLNALGTDAIKVGLIYQPAKVTPVGVTAALNSDEFVTGGDSDPRNRPALAQTFVENDTGGRLTVVVNHLKSKGSACDAPDANDGQGNCNAVRLNAALLLAEWLRTDPTSSGDPDVLIVGDLNSYAMEDPIMALEEFGFTNLILKFVGPDAYSYAFDGQWGYLDHALGSASLVSQVTGVTEYHINSDEPSVLDYNIEFKSAGQVASLFAPDQFRASDHDPVIVGLDLNASPVVGKIEVTYDPVKINTPITASASFTDADKLDTHTAVWNWGDGTTSAGVVLESEGSGTVSGEHLYTAPGIYTITVTVFDDSGNSGTSKSHPVVIYDPDGGFVTGGGWIYSAPGAAVDVPGASGEAQFAFVSKYHKSATKPKGNITFYFEAAGIHFTSTSIEYLVVNTAGTEAIFKGSGVYNDVGNYKFMIWVEDGKPDTFRIKIWTARSKNTYVVYDNGDYQPINGGSIHIHTGK